MAAQDRIGFDRELRLEWLDAVAAQAARGADANAARKWLDQNLADAVGGDRHGGPRDKTIVKLCKIWVSPPESSRPLRDWAIELLPDTDSSQRLALHWGLAMAAYPFFGSVADAVGRLLALQDDVERAAVVRRIYETWGERPFVNRAARAVWNSFVLWGVLLNAERRGRVVPPKTRMRLSNETEMFLIEAALCWVGNRPLPLSSLVSLPCMFPFDMSNTSTIVRASRRVHVSREGSNLDVVRAL
jgi:hypothetical protein